MLENTSVSETVTDTLFTAEPEFAFLTVPYKTAFSVSPVEFEKEYFRKLASD